MRAPRNCFTLRPTGLILRGFRWSGAHTDGQSWVLAKYTRVAAAGRSPPVHVKHTGQIEEHLSIEYCSTPGASSSVQLITRADMAIKFIALLENAYIFRVSFVFHLKPRRTHFDPWLCLGTFAITQPSLLLSTTTGFFQIRAETRSQLA